MPLCTIPHTFNEGEVVDRRRVEENFDELARVANHLDGGNLSSVPVAATGPDNGTLILPVNLAVTAPTVVGGSIANVGINPGALADGFTSDVEVGIVVGDTWTLTRWEVWVASLVGGTPFCSFRIYRNGILEAGTLLTATNAAGEFLGEDENIACAVGDSLMIRATTDGVTAVYLPRAFLHFECSRLA